jgi:hypothetical protein
MTVEAVIRKPVSTTPFPAYRDKEQGIFHNSIFEGLVRLNSSMNTRDLEQFP